MRLAVILVSAYLTLLVLATTSRSDTGAAGRLLAGLRCVHSHEAAWDDPGPPYYGGLQMDWDFMRAYGPEFLRAFGTADHWPPVVQLTVGMRAILAGRGWSPWPNTARLCGLLP